MKTLADIIGPNGANKLSKLKSLNSALKKLILSFIKIFVVK